MRFRLGDRRHRSSSSLTRAPGPGSAGLRNVTPAPSRPAPWPLAGRPSSCASARRPPSAAPPSSHASVWRPPWRPSSCRAGRPAGRCLRSPRSHVKWQQAGPSTTVPRSVVRPGFHFSTSRPASFDTIRHRMGPMRRTREPAASPPPPSLSEQQAAGRRGYRCGAPDSVNPAPAS